MQGYEASVVDSLKPLAAFRAQIPDRFWARLFPAPSLERVNESNERDSAHLRRPVCPEMATGKRPSHISDPIFEDPSVL